MSIVVLCPTRGRPEAVMAAAQSLNVTRLHGDTRLVAVVDADDPCADEYYGGANSMYDIMSPEHAGGMVAALNAAALETIRADPDATILGFIGDDHRFRTKQWDHEITQALKRKPGFAYAYDGFWHKGEIPTQVFISRPIVHALGYFALPSCNHLYVDNAWRALADATSTLSYLPDLLIEHMHPAIGKAKSDEGYERVNSQENWEHDHAAFTRWRGSPQFAVDVSRVRGALGPATISIRTR